MTSSESPDSSPHHGSLSQEQYNSRVEAGLPIRPAEAMNPKAQAIKSMEMTIKRARLLDMLMAGLLKVIPIGELRRSGPAGWADIEIRDVRSGEVKVRGSGVLAKEIWGDPVYAHPEVRVGWGTVVDLWYTGANRRGERRLLDNLPDKVRAKLE